MALNEVVLNKEGGGEKKEEGGGEEKEGKLYLMMSPLTTHL